VALDRHLIGGSGINAMWKRRTKRQDSQTHRAPVLRKRGLIVRRLLKDEGGATAIEFATVALIIIYFLLGIVEYGVVMTVSNSLEAATNMSSRLGKTGYVEGGQTQKDTIRDEIERRVGPLIDMSKLTITHEVYNDFQSLTTPDIFTDVRGDAEGSPPDGDTDDPGEWTDVDGDGFKDGVSGLGTAGNIVIYRIMYPWKLMTPLIGPFFGEDGIASLTAYSVVKNEPY
jgi:Flp pilus assembly pilin Flp